MPATTDEEFVDALPTHELHVHLEGSMPPETLLALARRHGTPGLPRDLDGIRRMYEFRDFDHFIATYLTVVDNLRDTEDFRLLTEVVLHRLAEQGVRYAEITWTPVIHTGRGLAVADVFAGLEAAREAAEARGGPVVRWVTDLPGHLGTEAAEETLDLVLRLGGGVPPDSVVGFGLGGPEAPRWTTSAPSGSGTMFGTSIRQEHLACLHELGLSRAQLVACTRTAATAGSAPAALVERTLADLAVVERDHVGA